MDPCAWPRAAARASSGERRQDSRHLQPQQARALGRMPRRGPSSLQQGDASRQRPLDTPPSDASASRILRAATTASGKPPPSPTSTRGDRTGHRHPHPSTTSYLLYPGELVPIPLCSPALTDSVQSRWRAPRRRHARPPRPAQRVPCSCVQACHFVLVDPAHICSLYELYCTPASCYANHHAIPDLLVSHRHHRTAIGRRQQDTTWWTRLSLGRGRSAECLPDNTRPCTMASGGRSATLVGVWEGGVRWPKACCGGTACCGGVSA